MEKLTIGKVRSSSGVKGYFKVLSHSGETAHFKKLKGKSVEFRLDSKSKFLKVEDVRISGSVPLLKVFGIDSPEDAKKLSNWQIFVDRSSTAPLKKEEFYHADLCNCVLFFNNEEVGQVKAVCDNGIADMLEIRYKDKTIFVPFLDRFIGEVDIKNNRIELKEDWFLK